MTAPDWIALAAGVVGVALCLVGLALVLRDVVRSWRSLRLPGPEPVGGLRCPSCGVYHRDVPHEHVPGQHHVYDCGYCGCRFAWWGQFRWMLVSKRGGK